MSETARIMLTDQSTCGDGIITVEFDHYQINLDGSLEFSLIDEICFGGWLVIAPGKWQFFRVQRKEEMNEGQG